VCSSDLGAVPGSKGSWIMVRDAVKKARPVDAPLPAALRSVAPAEAAASEGAE